MSTAGVERGGKAHHHEEKVQGSAGLGKQVMPKHPADRIIPRVLLPRAIQRAAALALLRLPPEGVTTHRRATAHVA